MGARRVSFTAISAALALAFLYMGVLFPMMSLSIAAVAGLFTAVAVIEGGYAYGAFCFVTAGLLGLLLFPLGVTILYAAFFGGYPLIKSFAERRQGFFLPWLIKFAVFFAALTLIFTVLGRFLLDIGPFLDWAWPYLYIAGALAFVAYDFGMGKLIAFYLDRVYKHRNRW